MIILLHALLLLRGEKPVERQEVAKKQTSSSTMFSVKSVQGRFATSSPFASLSGVEIVMESRHRNDFFLLRTIQMTAINLHETRKQHSCLLSSLFMLRVKRHLSKNG